MNPQLITTLAILRGMGYACLLAWLSFSAFPYVSEWLKIMMRMPV